jgi:aminopeptidase N
VWEDFVLGKAAALHPDALESTHPIYSPVQTPAQATELFDLITYQKGSSVMRMIEAFLGEDAFRAGLRAYMREFAESNAKGADLWRHLGAASGQPVAEIMESWVGQGGHPVVRVERHGAALRVGQRRFLSSPRAKASAQLWRVPLVLRWKDAAGAHESRHLLTQENGEVPLRVQGELQYVTANVEGIGFYRQDLDDALHAALLAHVAELPPAEQMGLLDDQWGLARNATHPITRYLATLDAVMRNATNPTVLDRVVDDATSVEGLLEDAGDAEALARFRAWVGAAFAPRMTRLSAEPRAGEPRDDALARAATLRAMSSLAHDRQAIAAASAYADREADDPQKVDANLAGTAVTVAAQFGDLARLAKHVRLYEERRAKGAPPADTQRYLASLASFRGDAALLQVLALIDQRQMPLEAVGPLLRLMFSERAARLPAWSYLKAHFPALRESLGDMWTGNLVEASGQIPPRFKDDFVQFYAANLGAVAQQAYARALESLELRGEFQSRTKADLVAWFRAR